VSVVADHGLQGHASPARACIQAEAKTVSDMQRLLWDIIRDLQVFRYVATSLPLNAVEVLPLRAVDEGVAMKLIFDRMYSDRV